MGRSADYRVEVVDDSQVADVSVWVVNGEVVDLTGAADGQVITVQPDGTLAAESLPPSGPPGSHAATHEDGGTDEVTLAQSQIVGLIADLAAKQPSDADLSAIAALTTTPFGRSVLELATAAAARTLWGLGTAATSNTGDFDPAGAAAAKVTQTIINGATTTAPSEDAVFDALAAKADTSALTAKADLASPALTGNPTAPTAAPGDNDTSIATTAFVAAADAALVVDSIADADTTRAPSRNAVFDALALKAPLASPTFTGTVTVPSVAFTGGLTDSMAGIVRTVRSTAPGVSVFGVVPNGANTSALYSFGTDYAADQTNFEAVVLSASPGAESVLQTEAGGTGTRRGLKINTLRLGFFNVTPATQPAGNSDVLASLVTLGLRAASANPPLNLGSGTLTCGQINAASPVMIPNGTEAAPGLAFTNDADGSGTGIYRVSANTIGFATNGVLQLTLAASAVTLAEGTHIALGTTTGSALATGTTQKLSFHGVTPVVRRAGAAQDAVTTTGASNVTPYGFTTAAQANAIVTLVNELRAALVEKGLIKGSA